MCVTKHTHTHTHTYTQIEDGCLVRIVLCKSKRTADASWPSLLKGQYSADAATFDEIEKKMTLERFQKEVSI